MARREKPLFREVQSMNQLWFAMLACLLGGLVSLGIALKMVLSWWGVGTPLPEIDSAWEHWLVLAITALGGAGLIALPFICRLAVEVRGEGLFVRYFPFHWRWRQIEMADLTSHRAITYSPIRDYGGWGMRLGPKGKAYTVSGDQGVFFDFDGKRDLMIGSRSPKQLERAVSKMLEMNRSR